MRFSIYLAPLFAFAAAVVGVFGPTSDEHGQGLAKVTWTGWGAILIALLALLATLRQTIETQKRDVGLKKIAYGELKSGIARIRTIFLFAASIPAYSEMSSPLPQLVSGAAFHDDKTDNVTYSKRLLNISYNHFQAPEQ